MIILFTGHRNKSVLITELEGIMEQYPNSTWLHGGARGFDNQVSRFAKEHSILEEIVRPDYKKYHPKQAPLMRNNQMLAKADLVVACYDGRTSGGTYYTIQKAKKLELPIMVLRLSLSSARISYESN